jgi:hypothetical protein
MALTRSDLFDAARKAGWKPGRPVTPPVLVALRAALTAALTETRERPIVVHGGDWRPMTADETVDALLEELS